MSLPLYRSDSSSFIERDNQAINLPAYSSITRAANRPTNRPTNRPVDPANYRSNYRSSHRPNYRRAVHHSNSHHAFSQSDFFEEDLISSEHINDHSVGTIDSPVIQPTSHSVNEARRWSINRCARLCCPSRSSVNHFFRICCPTGQSINLLIQLMYLVFTLTTIFYATYCLSHIARLCKNLSIILINLAAHLSISYVLAIGWLVVRYRKARLDWVMKFIDRLKRSTSQAANRLAHDRHNDVPSLAQSTNQSVALLSDYDAINQSITEPTNHSPSSPIGELHADQSVDQSVNQSSRSLVSPSHNQSSDQRDSQITSPESLSSNHSVDQSDALTSVNPAGHSSTPRSNASMQSFNQPVKRRCTKSCALVVLFQLYQSLLFSLCVFLFCFTLFLQRKTEVRLSGALALPGVRTGVLVSRDVNSYIHILGDNWHDVFYSQGVVMMQSRMWQIHLQRLIGQGRVSEFIGKRAWGRSFLSQNMLSDENTLLIDQSSRLFDFYGAAERSLSSLSNQSIDHLNAFVDGMNDYLDTDPPLQLEFWVLDLDKPTPFTIVDVLVFAKIFSYTLAGNLENELERMELLIAKNVSADRIDQLMPAYDTSRWPTVVQSYNQTYTSQSTNRSTSQQFNSTAEPIVEWYPAHCASTKKSHIQSINRSIKQLRSFFGRSKASNGWVISGDRSDTGDSILANDPHMTFAAPSLFLLMHLEVSPGRQQDRADHSSTDELRIVPLNSQMNSRSHLEPPPPDPPGPPGRRFHEEVIGASLMGLPSVLIGHNNATAWGITNSGADAQDVFVLMDSGDGSQYWYNDSWVPYQSVNQTIIVNGQDDVSFTFRRSVYGPVISDLDPSMFRTTNDRWSYQPSNQSSNQCSFALHWVSLFDNDTSMDAYLGLQHVQSFDQFRSALKQFVGPSENYLYASKHDIGYQLTGMLPLRVDGHSGRLPVPGDGKYDWRGYVAWDDMPSVSNPPEGYIVTANNRVTSVDSPIVISADWDELSEGMRARRIINMLTHDGGKNHTTDTMRMIQSDQKSLLYADFKPLVQVLQPSTDEGLLWQQNMQLFDGDMDFSEAATVFQLFMRSLARVTMDEIGRGNENPVFLYNVFLRGQAEPGCDHYRSFDRSLNQSMMQSIRPTSRSGNQPVDDPARPSVGCLAWASDQWDAVIDSSTSAPIWGVEVKPAFFKHALLGDGWLSCMANRVVQHGGDDYTVNVGHAAVDGSIDASMDQSCESSVNPIITLKNVLSTGSPPLAQTHGPSYRQIVDLSNIQQSLWQNTLGNGGDLFASGYDQELDEWADAELAPMRTVMFDRNVVQFLSRDGRQPFDPDDDDSF